MLLQRSAHDTRHVLASNEIIASRSFNPIIGEFFRLQLVCAWKNTMHRSGNVKADNNMAIGSFTKFQHRFSRRTHSNAHKFRAEKRANERMNERMERNVLHRECEREAAAATVAAGAAAAAASTC